MLYGVLLRLQAHTMVWGLKKKLLPRTGYTGTCIKGQTP